MGPNGSGKTTLAYALMGHPAYVVKSGEVLWKGRDLLKLSPDKRSRLGLFLAFQYPTAIPGLSVASFIRSALNAKLQGIDKNPDIDPTDSVKGGVSMRDFRNKMREKMAMLRMDEGFATRYVNEGFSGGEKKRLEMLQMAVLEPEMAILDETDSGLDIDALRIVAEGVNAMLNPDLGVLLITHYQRLLNYIKPDYVHVLAEGRIVKSGRQGARAAARGGGLRPDPSRGRPGRERPRPRAAGAEGPGASTTSRIPSASPWRPPARRATTPWPSRRPPARGCSRPTSSGSTPACAPATSGRWSLPSARTPASMFVGVPAGPFEGRAAIDTAYRQMPPDDEIDVISVDESDEATVVAR